MYIFKYIKGQVYHNGLLLGTFEEFKKSKPRFPIKEGIYFEYREDGFDLINEHGHHIATDEKEYKTLIKAILKL